MEWLCRLEEVEGRISRILDYCLCPETQTEVSEKLGLPVRNWGHKLSDEVLQSDRDRAETP